MYFAKVMVELFLRQPRLAVAVDSDDDQTLISVRHGCGLVQAKSLHGRVIDRVWGSLGLFIYEF